MLRNYAEIGFDAAYRYSGAFLWPVQDIAVLANRRDAPRSHPDGVVFENILQSHAFLSDDVRDRDRLCLCHCTDDQSFPLQFSESLRENAGIDRGELFNDLREAEFLSFPERLQDQQIPLL